MHRLVLLSFLFLFSVVYAQTTITAVDAQGETVIGVVTVDPNAGVTMTTIISTVAATTSSATTTTTPIDQQGPVGQPAPTTGTPGAPTPYVYTTLVNGVLTEVTDTFTPTDISTTPVQPTVTGTILDYNSWLSIYGQQTGGATSGARPTISSLPWTWAAVVGGLIFSVSMGCVA
ncbi:hypothetical protein BDQ17DRAFT_1543139 [Cyathus striatus]|nr:hypothetical protein BDQ17DRAFT_1543139 [Cyathus striatus]